MTKQTFTRWIRPWFVGLALMSPWAVPVDTTAWLLERSQGAARRAER
jgi:hypothetical protein